MKKEEIIEKYGEEEYKRRLAHNRAWQEEHPEDVKAAAKKYYEEHPEEVKANSQEQHRKGGKHYNKHLKDNRTGLQGERNAIRHKHGKEYKLYKQIIAPESQLHHEWILRTSKYRGVALVETYAHIHGFVKVIEILDGEITLRTEEEVKNGRGKI